MRTVHQVNTFASLRHSPAWAVPPSSRPHMLLLTSLDSGGTHVMDGGGEGGLVEGQLDESWSHEHVSPAIDDDPLAGALV